MNNQSLHTTNTRRKSTVHFEVSESESNIADRGATNSVTSSANNSNTNINTVTNAIDFIYLKENEEQPLIKDPSTSRQRSESDAKQVGFTSINQHEVSQDYRNYSTPLHNNNTGDAALHSTSSGHADVEVRLTSDTHAIQLHENNNLSKSRSHSILSHDQKPKVMTFLQSLLISSEEQQGVTVDHCSAPNEVSSVDAGTSNNAAISTLNDVSASEVITSDSAEVIKEVTLDKKDDNDEGVASAEDMKTITTIFETKSTEYAVDKEGETEAHTNEEKRKETEKEVINDITSASTDVADVSHTSHVEVASEPMASNDLQDSATDMQAFSDEVGNIFYFDPKHQLFYDSEGKVVVIPTSQPDTVVADTSTSDEVREVFPIVAGISSNSNGGEAFTSSVTSANDNSSFSSSSISVPQQNAAHFEWQMFADEVGNIVYLDPQSGIYYDSNGHVLQVSLPPDNNNNNEPGDEVSREAIQAENEVSNMNTSATDKQSPSQSVDIQAFMDEVGNIVYFDPQSQQYFDTHGNILYENTQVDVTSSTNINMYMNMYTDMAHINRNINNYYANVVTVGISSSVQNEVATSNIAGTNRDTSSVAIVPEKRQPRSEYLLLNCLISFR